MSRPATPALDVIALVRAASLTLPAAAAVSGEGSSTSYAGLWSAVDRGARQLVSQGVAPGSAVGIHGARSAQSVVHILSVLAAGGIVVPLDHSYPPGRLSAMVEDAAPFVVIGTGQPPLKATGRQHEPDPGLAYVVFTSGSTGRPKGVRFRRSSLDGLIRWQAGDSVVGPLAPTTHLAPMSFDVSFQEIFATLCIGGELVVVPEETKGDPEALWRVIIDREVQRVFIPYVGLQLLALFTPPTSALTRAHLREIICSGEQLRCTPQIRELLARLHGCELVNQYGPSETHVVARHRLSGDPDRWPDVVPIGTAVAGSRLTVHAEADLAASPRSAPGTGELWIGGPPVAAGYLPGPNVPTDNFIPGKQPDDMVYRTGDLVRADSSGVLQYVGRVDDQVKVRGYRVELGEVHAALFSHPRVREAAIAVAGKDSMSRRLAAFFTGDARPDDVRAYLSRQLPAYMVPAVVRRVPVMPVDQNGKLDRRRLLDDNAQLPEAEDHG